ncbi:MAG: SUMF1/EgtB/PvdO family nonheme iron enzyme [Bacteroidales bacterium]|nr:SUMF1/EgtB/PvdO family nonheme iron enzyme [Bacteroidales bacterium]
MNRINRNLALLFVMTAAISLFSCSEPTPSRTTGWPYNTPEAGGFEVSETREQFAGPGLIFIEGGTFVMGSTQEDLMFDWDNFPRRVTIPSFYIDETEVSNLAYLEYLYWLNRVFGEDYPEVYREALPDTLVWRDRLAYNEPLVEMYLRHPAYHDYPVVGVTWVQANNYCSWRSDRVNEMLLVEEGILEWDPDQKNENNFNTEAYLAGQYEGLVKEGKENLDPTGSDIRQVRIEDGILLPRYRLPTAAEWEYAALGLIGNTLYERVVERRVYPWNGQQVRTDDRKYYGSFVSNFKRGRGDYMGVAGNLNDGADIPAPVGSYWPNDYGLYNMAGNVSEWTLDVYRPLSYLDFSDYSPYRGNVFKKKEVDFEGFLVEKDSLGRIQYEEVTTEESLTRRNYRKADNINYKDGDHQSQITTDWLSEPDQSNTSEEMYEYGVTSLISDEARVYKGGSWKDRAYYLSPGARRFLDQNEASSTIGFRCAMTRVGSPEPPQGR